MSFVIFSSFTLTSPMIEALSAPIAGGAHKKLSCNLQSLSRILDSLSDFGRPSRVRLYKSSDATLMLDIAIARDGELLLKLLLGPLLLLLVLEDFAELITSLLLSKCASSSPISRPTAGA